MENKILELEKNMFKVKYMSDLKWLERTLHENFKECGKSGYLYSQKGTIEFFLSCKEDRKIIIYNFECEKVDSNTWIAHYITKTTNDEKYFRTSIWVMDNNLKLLFHQATKINYEVELIKS